ncbi:MAG: SDR family NAD(P)-dependent oxidoreductase [Mycobacteriales bacterium]
MDSMTGKVALVTGASRGIGAATARALSVAGASVVLAARDADALADVAGSLPGPASVVPTDVTDEAQVERVVERTLAAYGRLDAAVNNAGASHRPTPLAGIEVADFDRIVAVDLRAVFLALRAELPAMAPGGAIVNVSSRAGTHGVPGMGAYAAAKHGVIGLTRVAALDYAERGIRVNAVTPGSVEAGGLAVMDDATKAQVGKWAPLGRIARAEEIAAAIRWLCSDESSYLTGAVLEIDGGQTAR